MSLNITNLYSLGGAGSAQRHDRFVEAGGSTGLVATFGPIVALIGHSLSNDALERLSGDLDGSRLIAAQSFEGHAAQATAFSGGREVASAIFGHRSWLALADSFNAMIASDPLAAKDKGWEEMVIPHERISGGPWWLEHAFGIDDSEALDALVADDMGAEEGLVTLLDAVGVSEYLTMLIPAMVRPDEFALRPDRVSHLGAST